MISQATFKIVPGTYVTTSRMAPVMVVYTPYILSQFTPLVPSLEAIDPYIAASAGASFMTAAIAATASARPWFKPNSRRRHNRYLCIGAASMTGLKTIKAAFPPLYAKPQEILEMGLSLAAIALTTALLWAKKPKRVQLKTAQTSQQAIPA